MHVSAKTTPVAQLKGCSTSGLVNLVSESAEYYFDLNNKASKNNYNK